MATNDADNEKFSLKVLKDRERKSTTNIGAMNWDGKREGEGEVEQLVE